MKLFAFWTATALLDLWFALTDPRILHNQSGALVVVGGLSFALVVVAAVLAWREAWRKAPR